MTMSAWVCPIVHNTTCEVSALCSTRSDGSPAQAVAARSAACPRRPRVAAFTAAGSSASGMSHGSMTSGVSLSERVSEVRAAGSFATTAMSPAIALSLGRSIPPAAN